MWNLKFNFAPIKNKINEQKISFTRKRLEKELSHIIILANSHLEKGTPNGSPVFINLANNADKKIEEFIYYVEKTTNKLITKNEIKEQLPALSILDELIIPKQKIPLGFKFLGGIIGIIFIIFITGLASGLFTVSYHLLVH
jgi:hypothetical protein